MIFEHVPCWVCDYCGEPYFAVTTLKHIESEHIQIVKNQHKPARYHNRGNS